MPYTDLIKQEGEYNYSANIQFDIENDHKLGRFIPNETTVSLIREYFIDISREKPNYHSRILYGSYGTGNSEPKWQEKHRVRKTVGRLEKDETISG